MLTSIPSDVFTFLLSFCKSNEIAAFGRTSKESYLLTSKYYLNTVHNTAWIDADGGYHIKHISSIERDQKIENLTKLTCINDNKPREYLLECRTDQYLFDWTVFVTKQLRGAELNDTKGFWKILNKKATIISHLNAIKSLVMHKQIAPNLLDYKSTETPFKSPITISIHNGDNNNNMMNKYDLLFWNGASPNQTNTFQIYDHQKQKKYYYMQFRSSLPNISWKWYDNDSSQFKEYCFGLKLKSQIECSFQANLLYNFPLKLQREKLFNNINLTVLKKEFIKEYGSYHQDKVFILRFGFDETNDENRSIVTIEQITVTTHGFPRSVKRINADKQYINDFGEIVDDAFNLRMKPLEIMLKA